MQANVILADKPARSYTISQDQPPAGFGGPVRSPRGCALGPCISGVYQYIMRYNVEPRPPVMLPNVIKELALSKIWSIQPAPSQGFGKALVKLVVSPASRREGVARQLP